MAAPRAEQDGPETPRTAWFGLVASSVVPLATAAVHAAYALAPARFPEDFSMWFWTLFIAQVPLALLGAAFAGASYIEGPAWRRVLAYVIVVGLVGGIAALTGKWLDTELAAIIAWAIVVQVLQLCFVGPRPALACARIEAAAGDSVKLVVLCVWAGFLATFAAALLGQYAREFLAHHAIVFEWSDLAWVGAAYWVLRAWSAAYTYSAAFERRGNQGYFDRKWINWLIANLGKSGKPGEN